MKFESKNDEDEFIEIGPKWYMRVNRTELASEYMRLIKFHYLKHGLKQLTANQIAFVERDSADITQERNIQLKILPFSVVTDVTNIALDDQFQTNSTRQDPAKENNFIQQNQNDEQLISNMLSSYLDNFSTEQPEFDTHN